MTLVTLLITAVVALGGACAILLILRFRKPFETTKRDEVNHAIVLLFCDGELADATQGALDIVGSDLGHLTDFTALLASAFPDLSGRLADQDNASFSMISPVDSTQSLRASHRNQTLRIELTGDFSGLETKNPETKTLLQDLTTFSPQLVWQEGRDGDVLWSNAAYRNYTKSHGGIAKIAFEQTEQGRDDVTPQQQRLRVQGDKKQWFDVVSVRRADHVLHFANDATSLMRADKDRREFVKTLGKTFADLSIGLAIFNNARQLVMFNPALVDMTNLPVPFLSEQPAIDTVLDRMREMRMMPEPKDYNSWREQFMAVEAAAKNGTYSENWSLPDGQTYRVTGRPHPDGAFALLFEDITAEVSLTRRFRSDIETGQAVLDTLPDAIAVFSGAGTMVMSNGAYSRLWDTPEDLMLTHRELRSELAIWQDTCIASPMWTQMRDFIQRLGTRKPWSDDAMLVDGRHLRCHAIPIAGGMTMVRFVIAPPMQPVIQKLTQVDPAIRAGKG